VGTRTYGFLDTTLTVESKDEPALTWLDEMLAPWFETPARGAELHFAVWHVEGAGDSPLDRGTHAEVRPFMRLDSRVIRLPVRRWGPRIVVDDAEEGCRYILDGPGVTVETRDSPGRLALMRIVREIAVEHERRHARALELHAAALEMGGGAIILVGPKSSGKTTFLLHTLARHSARLVANDHVLVDVWTGQPRVIGVPTVIRIHPRTAAALPSLTAGVPQVAGPFTMTRAETREALAAREPVEGATELRLSAAQLAASLPTGLRAAAPLRAVVFPEIGAGGDAPSFDRLSAPEADTRLRASIYGGHGNEDAPTVLTELVAGSCARSQRGAAIRHAMAELATGLTSRVPCFRLVPGPDLQAAIDLLVHGALT